MSPSLGAAPATQVALVMEEGPATAGADETTATAVAEEAPATAGADETPATAAAEEALAMVLEGLMMNGGGEEELSTCIAKEDDAKLCLNESTFLIP